MATGKVIGRVEVSVGNVKIVGVDGNVRNCAFGDLMYEGEQIYSEDPNALFQIKYLALSESSAYDGVFRVLADGSVIAGLDGNENLFGDDIDLLETAAGEGVLPASSAFLEEPVEVDTNMLGFSRGADSSEYGAGITGFGVGDDPTDQTPPVITSPNNIVYDENGEGIILQITADDTSALTYSIDGLDSALFTIDEKTGEINFINPPDYENPQDIGGDNEYNMYVTVTDAAGNFTTQLISININNVNDNAPTAEDDQITATEDVIDDINGQLIGGDADGNGIEFILVDGLKEGEGHLIFNSDGSYTYNVGEDFQELAEGETREVTFTYKTSETGTEEDFESEVATVTIIVTGTNDAPVVEAVVGSVQAEVIDGLNVFTGALSATDVDGFITGITIGAASVEPAFNTSDFSVVFDGTNYVVTGDFNPLAVGESTQVSFQYTATDDFGASSTGTVVLTVTGTNDAPVVSSVVMGPLQTFEDFSMFLHNRVEAEFDDVDERGDMTLVITTPHGEVDYRLGDLDVRVDEVNSTPHQLVLIGSTDDLEALFNGGFLDGYFLKYTPDPNSDVDEEFHVELVDEYGASDFFMEAITVDAVSGLAHIDIINTHTNEDTAVTQDLRVTFTDVDDTNEGHWVSFNVPDGWTVTDANGWTYVGHGTWVNDVSAEVDAKADDNGVDGRYDVATIFVQTPTMLPPANSDYDASDFAVAGVYDVATDAEITYWNNTRIDMDSGSIIVDAVVGGVEVELLADQVREDGYTTPQIEATFHDAYDLNEAQGLLFVVPEGWSVSNAGDWISIADVIDNVQAIQGYDGHGQNGPIGQYLYDTFPSVIENLMSMTGEDGKQYGEVYTTVEEFVAYLDNNYVEFEASLDAMYVQDISAKVDQAVLDGDATGGIRHGDITIVVDAPTILPPQDSNLDINDLTVMAGNLEFVSDEEVVLWNNFKADIDTDGVIDIIPVNDDPVAMDDDVIKVLDDVTVLKLPVDISAFTYNPYTGEVNNNANVVITNHGRYSVDDTNILFSYSTWSWSFLTGLVETEHDVYDEDINNQIDSVGLYDEGLIFAFENEVDTATIDLTNIDSLDNVGIRIYNSSNQFIDIDTSTITHHNSEIVIDEGYSFDRIVIYAINSTHPISDPTDFKVVSVDGFDADISTVLPFTIDDAVLLANDVDVDGDTLEVGLVTGDLLAGQTSDNVIGTVTIDNNGDVQVTPNQMYEINTDSDNAARFEYTVDDGNGGVDSAVAYIDLSTGEVTGTNVIPATTDPTLVVTGSDILDLSNVSGIDTVVLETGASISEINVEDVLSASENDSLVIKSYDGNASDQVIVGTDFGIANTIIGTDGQSYLEYDSGGATLLIEILNPDEIV